MVDEVDFLPAVSTKVFYKLTISFWVFVTRHAQATQSKFAISFRYLKKNVKDEVDFLYAD